MIESEISASRMSTKKSRKTKAQQTGNRQGLIPARKVGQFFFNHSYETTFYGNEESQDKCLFGMEAKHLLSISSEDYGGSSLYPLFAFLIIMVLLSAIPFFAHAHGVNKIDITRQKLPVFKQQAATEEEISAARGIEALLVEHMIQEMRKSVQESELLPLSQGEKIYRQMLDVEYAKKISDANMLGIADIVLAEIKGER